MPCLLVLSINNFKMQSTQLGHRRTCEGAEETLLQPAQTLLIPSLRTEENDLMEN